MRNVQGSLSLMSVTDVMQWAEHSKRTGTLFLKNDGSEKKVYFQDGMVILVSSDKEGERLSEFLVAAGIAPEAIKETFQTADTLGLPFSGCLLSSGVIERGQLEDILNRIAERAIRDALR